MVKDCGKTVSVLLSKHNISTINWPKDPENCRADSDNISLVEVKTGFTDKTLKLIFSKSEVIIERDFICHLP